MVRGESSGVSVFRVAEGAFCLWGLPQIQKAGCWSSLTMPRRHVEESEIASDGMA
jgi:hypothetical protein